MFEIVILLGSDWQCKVGVCLCVAFFVDDWCLKLMFCYVVIGYVKLVCVLVVPFLLMICV